MPLEQFLPPVETVPDALSEWAKRAGNREFLFLPEEKGNALTFSALDAAVSRAARALADSGVGAGSRVSLLLGNSIEMVLLFLGVMRLGAVANPLNILLSANELAPQLEDARPALICADAANAKKLEGSDFLPAPLVRATGGAELELNEMRPAPEGSSADPSPAGDALLLFTSGSTGRPKGTRLTHRNLLAGARFVAEAHRLTPEDRSLVILPLSHINGEVIAFLAPLLSGGSIVLPHRFRTGPFWDWLRNFHCTWFSAVPTIFSILIQKNKEAGSPAPGNLKHVRFARSASAALPVAVFHEFEKRFGLPVVETMGITEAAGMILTNPLPPGRRIAGSVGLPWGNEARIEDGNGSPLPPGEEGEVAAKGPNVMPGYFQNPAATREALSGGWLRTGDLGMRDDEGYFYITGRKKDLINRAGEMIAPREIDEVLYKHPDVLDAAALGIPHPLYGEEVKAFVVLRPGADCREEDILAYCRERLAEFKCPKSAAFIPDIPKGPSGKLLRSKLRSRYIGETS